MDHPADPHLAVGALLIRLGLTAGLCFLVGFERESRDQAAGLRTHTLVGLGSCLFTLISAYGFSGFYSVSHDPTRIAAQIVSGIGFLGAGAIMRSGFTVRGLTTAATLWLVAAIGMGVGSGLYLATAATTLMGLATLIIFRRFRPLLMGKVRNDWMIIEVNYGREKSLRRALAILASASLELNSIRTKELDGGRQAEIELRSPATVDSGHSLARLFGVDGLEIISISGFHAPSLTELQILHGAAAGEAEEEIAEEETDDARETKGPKAEKDPRDGKENRARGKS